MNGKLRMENGKWGEPKHRLVRHLCLSLCLALLLALNACLPALPPEQYIYVLHIGIARGEEQPYEVFLLVNQAGPGTGEENASSLQTLSAAVHNLPEAAVVLSAGMPFQLNFSRASLLVLSQELAQSGEIPEIMDIALPKLGLSPYMNLSITQSDMDALFKGMLCESDPALSKLTLNRKVSYQLEGMTVNNSLAQLTESRQSRAFDMLYTLMNVKGEGVQRDMVGEESHVYLAGSLPMQSAIDTEAMGTAAFSGDKMVGLLSGGHTMMLLMGTGAFQSGRLILPLAGETVPITLHSAGKPKVQLSGESAIVSVSLKADVEKPSLRDRLGAAELERLIGEAIAEEMAQVFAAVQAADADVFGFGKTAIKQNAGGRDAETWRKTYPKLRASFSVRVSFVSD